MAAIIERVPWLDDRVSIKRFTKELEDVGGSESIYAASPSCLGALSSDPLAALEAAVGAAFRLGAQVTAP